MNPGKLNKKIEFYRLIDKEGEELKKTGNEPNFLRSAWASVKSFTEKESFEENRISGRVPYDIRTRYIEELYDDTLVILYRGKRLEITSVVNVREENKELAFTAVEIKKSGGGYGDCYGRVDFDFI